MAVTFETKQAVERGSSYFFTPSDIVIDAANNGRHTLPDITALIADIKANGQQIPVLVRKDGTRPVLVEGHSRWRSIVEINKDLPPDKRLKVWAVYMRGNEVDGLIAGFSANRLRNALTPVDEGYFVVRMEKYGKTLEEIATICGEDVPWVKQRRDLTMLVPDAQASVASGELNLNAAKSLSKLSSDVQRRALKERDKNGKVTPASIRAITSNGHAKKPARPSLTQVRAVLQGIAAHGEFPGGLGRSASVDKLCEWLIAFIDGDGA